MKKKFQRLPQPTPKELTDALLNFLRLKFYTELGDEKCFLQDRSRLLAWVVLWPAAWLNGRGVTLHGDAYREMFFKVFYQAAANMVSKVKYRPAYLRQVIQSHFKIHGEEYLAEGKNLRAITDRLLLFAGQAKQPGPDPIREMANARQILTSMQPKPRVKKLPKGAVNGTLNLELKLL